MDIFADSADAFLHALGTTVVMAIIAGAGALILGTLVAAARISPIPPLRAAAFAYVQFFVNVPLLALLILAVFALPDAGFILPLTPTAVLVLTAYEAAYVSEAIRSGVNTVGHGQIEASRALGFTLRQTLGLVVLPQALRAAVQPIGNVMIALTMNTALAAAVGVVELTSAANKLNLVEAQPILIFSAAGLTYMLLALCIGLSAGRIERKVAVLR
ncbi:MULTISPECIES: amino acid ABC transporter permease [unclassified Arthrobacter]|uniref:amino acid ABC transporter permease n=1 Tax=unclassified Arthrobacter TaxID=235627 RepID=UPI001D15C760|nr:MULTISPECIES: amino acid ABC transporter permease [unclassified Arthrobacter]MCC3274336.1 amino acid ABC transporter permease [Arthrobacter sp. zg-Y20]MCC3279670.1 amino acid ABC transporter permease [Arthrobacter sp. zg-Y40]MCC9178071.1 amino acid ABC transporter permease [Arthrobacter sp. zg-Y750]MDK1314492.1 amino acid ABC transporter permease [Arthrobacter sp. zg.Y20]MDK1327378.1 amino acid ABC transporter permease [Arthrobacter sp. zg-Y1143]